MNVNLFWVRPATEELVGIRRLLKPSGMLYLFYEPPSAGRLAGLASKVRGALAGGGFTVTELTASATGRPLLCLVGRVA